METVQTEGGRKIFRGVEYYNLDAVIVMGYRKIVSSEVYIRQ